MDRRVGVAIVVLLFVPLVWGGNARCVGPATARAIQGPLTFSESGQGINPLAARGIVLRDFDADGHLDAFFVNENTPDGEGHRVYFGDGRGRLRDSGQRLANPGNWGTPPAAGDVNGDGHDDVVTGNRVWLNDGKGRFAPRDDMIASGGAALRLVGLADLNRDGSPDLCGIAEWRTLRVYVNDGRGRFRDTGQRLGSGMIGAVALGDLDGDGSIDVLTGGWRAAPGEPSPVRVWLNDGSGALREGVTLDEAEHHVHGVALGDVNGDHQLDAVLAITTPGRAGKVYLNDGKGRLRDSGQILGHAWAHHASLGDLDGDGSLDVFLTCGEPRAGTPNEVWLNDGTGRFRDSRLRLGSAFSWDGALGDLNQDGRLDAVVANLRLVDASKTPPVFGGMPAEVWLNGPAASGARPPR